MNGRVAPDGGPASRHLDPLPGDECRMLLRTGRIGRVVFVDARGPVALPVNYVVDHDDIVFRTAPASSVLTSTSTSRVSFEVDHVDELRKEGWSVLATGTVSVIDDPADLRHVQLLGVTPWAERGRSVYLRLTVRSITGRRLVPDDSAPTSSRAE